MTETILLTTRDAAERLNVHARTIRKWIDSFEDYIQPDVNDRGHYMLNEESMQRLKDIQNRLQEPNKTMKQVREELLNEKRISEKAEEPETPSSMESSIGKNVQQMQQTMEGIGNLIEEMFHRMESLEDRMYSLFESLEDLEHKIAAVSYDTLSPSEVHQMFDEIRKKHDQLKIELRSVTFTQRLSSPMKEQNFVPRRQKKQRFFNLF